MVERPCNNHLQGDDDMPIWAESPNRGLSNWMVCYQLAILSYSDYYKEIHICLCCIKQQDVSNQLDAYSYLLCLHSL